MTVSKFVKEKVLDEYRPIISKFRKLMKNDFPEIKEEMRGGTEDYYGVPVYRKKRIIITISPTKKGITFSFSEGKKFQDKYSLLEGAGKKSLTLKISAVEDFDEKVFKYYIKQAIKYDE